MPRRSSVFLILTLALLAGCVHAARHADPLEDGTDECVDEVAVAPDSTDAGEGEPVAAEERTTRPGEPAIPSGVRLPDPPAVQSGPRPGRIPPSGDLVLPTYPRLPVPSAGQPASPTALHQGRIILERTQGVRQEDGHLVVIGFTISIGEPRSGLVWLVPASGPRRGEWGRISPELGDLRFDEVAPFTVYGALVTHVIPTRRGIFRSMDPDHEFERQAELLVDRMSARLGEEFAMTRAVSGGMPREEILEVVAHGVDATYTGVFEALRGWHPQNETDSAVAFWVHAPGLSEVDVQSASARRADTLLSGGLTPPGPFLFKIGFLGEGVTAVLR